MGKKSARHDERPPPWSFKPPSPTLWPGKNYLAWRGRGAAGRVGERSGELRGCCWWRGDGGVVTTSPGRVSAMPTASFLSSARHVTW
jgi:hypothetical protein